MGTPEALGDAVVADLGLDADGKIVTVAVNDVSERPIVGISWKSNTQNYSSFLEAFDRNGAKAVELPQIEKFGVFLNKRLCAYNYICCSIYDHRAYLLFFSRCSRACKKLYAYTKW